MPQMPSPAVADFQVEPKTSLQEPFRRITPELNPNALSAESGLNSIAESVERVRHADASSIAQGATARLRVAAEQALVAPQTSDGSSTTPTGGAGAAGAPARASAPASPTDAALSSFDKALQQELTQAGKGSGVGGFLGSGTLAQDMIQKSADELRASLQIRSIRQEAAGNVARRQANALDAANTAATAVELNPSSWQEAGAEQIKGVQALGLDPEQEVQLERHVHQAITYAATRGYAKQDPEGTLTRLNDPKDPLFSGLTPELRHSVEDYVKQQYVEHKAQGIQSIYEQGGTTAGSKALAAIDQDQSIPADMRDPIRNEVNKGVNEYRDQQRERNAPALAQLESNISTGNVGPHDRASAWSLYEHGAMSPTQLASAMAGISRAEQSMVDDGADLAAARDAYTKGSPLDPQNKDVKAGVTKLFTALTTASPAGSPEYVNRAVDITSRVGVAPAPAISWARTNLVGGDPKSAAAAADLISRLENANPRAVPFALDPKTKATAAVINNAVAAGTDPAVAVEMGRRAAQMPESELKAFDVRWKKAKLDQSQPGALRTLMQTADPEFKGGWFSSAPQIPTEMQAQFDQLTHSYYRDTGGDAQLARQLAARDVGNVWGVSRVNGAAQVMAYAPERMFPGLTPEVIHDDIHNLMPDVDVSKVRLVEDPQLTARSGGAVWNLEVPDKNGLRHIVLDQDSNPRAYQLPVTKQDYHAVREQERQTKLERLRADQAARKDVQPFADAVPGL